MTPRPEGRAASRARCRRAGPRVCASGSRALFALCWCLLVPAGAAALDCSPLPPRRAEELADVRYPHGLLWEIRAPGGARSYLFGTIHLSSPEVTAVPPAVTAALLRSKRFGMEVLLDLDTLLQIPETMYYQDDRTLSAQAGPALYARVQALLLDYGVPPAQAEKLKPWAAYTTLSLPPGPSAVPLDMVLMGTAQQRGQQLFGLETLAEQISIFEALPLADQITLLKDTVCHYREFQAETARMVEHYLQQDLNALFKTAKQYDAALQERLLDEMLVQRNRRMLERMRPYLAAGDAFIAVGALHLPGENGLLELLDARGFALKPVK